MDNLTLIFLSLFFITFGALVSVIYYSLQKSKTDEKTADKEEDKKDLLNEKEKLLLEYKTYNENVQNRGELTLVSGTIILTASVLVMVESLRNDLAGNLLIVSILTSLAIYVIWLSGYSTTRRLDDSAYSRMREIEERLGINVHRSMYEHVQKKTWYRAGRLIIWLLFFFILLAFGFIILWLKL